MPTYEIPPPKNAIDTREFVIRSICIIGMVVTLIGVIQFPINPSAAWPTFSTGVFFLGIGLGVVFSRPRPNIEYGQKLTKTRTPPSAPPLRMGPAVLTKEEQEKELEEVLKYDFS